MLEIEAIGVSRLSAGFGHLAVSGVEYALIQAHFVTRSARRCVATHDS